MNWYVLDDTVIGVRWGLSPHASSFKLKFTVLKTSNYTEFLSKCHLEIRPADLLDTLYSFNRWSPWSQSGGWKGRI